MAKKKLTAVQKAARDTLNKAKAADRAKLKAEKRTVNRQKWDVSQARAREDQRVEAAAALLLQFRTAPHDGSPRPTQYTEELGRIVCERIAAAECSLNLMCSLDRHLPERTTILNWRRANPEFDKAYEKAKQDQADLLADSTLDISNNTEIGERVKLTPNGMEVQRGDMLEHRKLKVETRKWIAAHLKRRLYGDSVALTGPNDGPILTQDVDTFTDEQLAAIASRGRTAPAEPETGTD